MMKLAERGADMASHGTHAVAPVVVGSVVWPAGHGEHVLGDTAWGTVENFPALQLMHRFVLPSLYRPAAHAVQAAAQSGQAVIPLASLAAGLQRTHADALATLPVPEGQAWQAVLALKAENFPAAHATHDVPDIIVPGGQVLQVVASPPME